MGPIPSRVRFPQIGVSLRTRNTFALAAAVRQALRQAAVDGEEIDRFSNLALGPTDPEECVRVCQEWVTLRLPGERPTGPASRGDG